MSIKMTTKKLKKKKKKPLTPEQHDLKKQAWARWYAKNKEVLNARRMERYYTDDEFRKKIMFHSANSQMRRKLVGGGKLHTLEFGGKTVVVYKLGYASKFLGVSIATIRHYELIGVIPKCSFDTFQRCYTKSQLNLMWEFFVALEGSGGTVLGLATHSDKHAPNCKGTKKIKTIMGAYMKKHWEEGLNNGKDAHKEISKT